MGLAEGARRSVRHWVDRYERQLNWFMALLGLLLLGVVLAEPLTRHPTLSSVLAVAGYLVWGAFVAEFLLRFWIAPDRRRFLRSGWWRIVLLAVPFLGFVRVLAAFRVATVGRGILSVVHGSSSAARLLSQRLVWLTAVTALVVLAASHLLYITHSYRSYAQALYHTAYTTISGQPLMVDSGLGQVVEIVLAAYSAIIFATLAGSIGAYFLTEPDGQSDQDRKPDQQVRQDQDPDRHQDGDR